MHTPKPSALARLQRLVPSFLVFAAFPLAGFAGIIAGSNFNVAVSNSDVNDDPFYYPDVSWAPTLVLANTPANDSFTSLSATAGTIDVQSNVNDVITAGVQTRGWRLFANFTGSGSTRSAEALSPVFPVTNYVRSALLNLSFDLWSNKTHPIIVRVEFFNSTTNRVGYREATIIPPVTNAYYRYSLDIASMAPFGNYDATSSHVRFSFALTGANGWPATTDNIVTLDNLRYTSPTHYVTPGGTGSGTSEASPGSLNTVLSAANPGDMILMKQGSAGQSYGKIDLKRGGRPHAWITLRAFPGELPVVRAANEYNTVTLDSLASYVELRGLTVRGFSTFATLADAEADYAQEDSSGFYNNNGIVIDGYKANDITNPAGRGAHHVRVADCIAYELTGAGIIAMKADYVYFENNVVYDNCHYMRFGGSGFSVLNSWNFDGNTRHKTFVIGNIAHHNRCDVKWKEEGKYSDGNGIIIDNNLGTDIGRPISNYLGRTLVQNNLSYRNGGSGIHAHQSRGVDIVNNTAYENAQPNQRDFVLPAAQIYAGYKSQDVRIVNNILWARVGRPINAVLDYATNAYFAYNLYGGNGSNPTPVAGNASGTNSNNTTVTTTSPSDIFAGPYNTPRNFRLKSSTTPGVNTGTSSGTGVPRDDLDGVLRPKGTGIDRGAYESY